jgi:eukaryotic-like serine/threonine-protein kinase
MAPRPTAGLAFIMGERAATSDPCAGSEALVAPMWETAAQARVHDAFRKTGRPYADDTFTRVDASLRLRLAGWARARRDACEATEVRHEQSGELLDQRIECLDQAKKELGALVGLLAQGDARVLDRAAQAAGSVGDVEACADIAVLRDQVRPPRQPGARMEVEALRGELANLRAQRELGKGKEALSAVRALLPRARALGFAPVLAVALYQAGVLESGASAETPTSAWSFCTSRPASPARPRTRGRSPTRSSRPCSLWAFPGTASTPPTSRTGRRSRRSLAPAIRRS